MLKATSRALAGQLIFPRLGQYFSIRFSMQLFDSYTEPTFKIRNRLSGRSAFKLLHFIHRLNRDLCFKYFSFYTSNSDGSVSMFCSDSYGAGRVRKVRKKVPALAGCMPFNNTILDSLDSVSGQNRRGIRLGWLHFKFLNYEYFKSDASSMLRQWMHPEYLVAVYVKHGKRPKRNYSNYLDWDALQGLITGYGLAHTYRKLRVHMRDNVDLDESTDTEAFERILQLLIDRLSSSGDASTIPILSLYFSPHWDGWKRLCPEAKATRHVGAEVGGDTVDEYTFLLPHGGHCGTGRESSSNLEVSIRYGPVDSADLFIRLCHKFTRQCEVVMKAISA